MVRDTVNSGRTHLFQLEGESHYRILGCIGLHIELHSDLRASSMSESGGNC